MKIYIFVKMVTVQIYHNFCHGFQLISLELVMQYNIPLDRINSSRGRRYISSLKLKFAFSEMVADEIRR